MPDDAPVMRTLLPSRFICILSPGTEAGCDWRTLKAMQILFRYLKDYWKLVAAALGLAAINQIFSLLDPLIFRHIIDSYATRFHDYTGAQFFQGVGLLLGAAVGVAFVSRVAKNFQDYFVN